MTSKGVNLLYCSKKSSELLRSSLPVKAQDLCIECLPILQHDPQWRPLLAALVSPESLQSALHYMGVGDNYSGLIYKKS